MKLNGWVKSFILDPHLLFQSPLNGAVEQYWSNKINYIIYLCLPKLKEEESVDVISYLRFTYHIRNKE